MTAPSPADVHGGRVVRLQARSRSWSSPVLTAAEAAELAVEVRSLVRDIGDSYGLFAFCCGDGRVVDVRARELVSIELCTTVSAPAPAEAPAEQVVRS